MHARVVLGVGKGVLLREVSSIQGCPSTVYLYTCINVVKPFSLSQAIVVGGGFFLTSYRHGYDISIPVFNYLTRSEELHLSSYTRCTGVDHMTVM